MVLGKEEDTGFTSALPFGPWSRLPTGQGIFVGIPQFRHL